MLIIYTYKQEDAISAKRLIKAAKEKGINSSLITREDIEKYPNKILFPDNSVVLNLGCSTYPKHTQLGNNITGYNKPCLVTITHNKLKTFYKLYKKIKMPKFTEKLEKAKTFTPPIIGRTVLTGAEGSGIIIYEDPQDVKQCKMYTEYISGTEYRVYFFKKEILNVFKKVEQKEKTKLFLKEIKTYTNGWEFKEIKQETLPNKEKLQNIINIISSEITMDFGGIDVIFDKKNWYLLEINSAPMLPHSTINFLLERL